MSFEAQRRPLLDGKRYILQIVGYSSLAVLLFYFAIWRDTLRICQASLINWFFWSGMAQGAVVFSAIIEITDSRWARPMKRIAECFAAFLPVSLMLFLMTWPSLLRLYPWLNTPPPGNGWWLTPWFMYFRDAAALAVLCGLSLTYVFYSIRPDLGVEGLCLPHEELRKLLAVRGDDTSGIEPALIRRKYLAAAVIIVFCLVYSLIGFDMLMSLAPTWASSLFGAYVFIIAEYGALAMIAVTSALLMRSPSLEGAIGEHQFHDLGKLLFAFCLLSMDFFWSQFLVIWYGNLPEETEFVILRAFERPWRVVTWTVLFGCFIAPFVLLMSRRVKMGRWSLFAVSLLIVAMVWLERFILVAPSAWVGENLPLGAPEIAATAFYGALFISSFAWLFDRAPALPITDPVFNGTKASRFVAPLG